MAVNLDGAFLGIRSALRTMIPKKNGGIALIASASGIKAAAGANPYCASKLAFACLPKRLHWSVKSMGFA